jgi:hypothetical protein
MFICHAIFDHLINLAFFSSESVKEVNRTILRNVHLSCDLQSSDQSRFLFFEMSRAGEQDYYEKRSFVTWSNHLINLAFFSSKSVKEVNRTMMRNVHLSCDLQSSDQSRFLFFEISKRGERTYGEKCLFVM